MGSHDTGELVGFRDLAESGPRLADDPPDELGRTLTLLTSVEVEFLDQVRPGDVVTVRAEKLLWRMRKLRSRVTMHRADDAVVCSGTVSGMGVPVKPP